jgi:hypothetical protein
MQPAEKEYYYALYIHDDWKVNSRLTLNLGFRWDYEAPLVEHYNRMVLGFDLNMASPIASKVQGLTLKGGLLYAGTSGTSRQAFNRDFKHPQPRVGFAYKLNDKTVMRGSYGVFFLRQYEEGPSTGYSQQTPLVSSIDGGLTPNVTLNNPFPNGLLQPIGNSQGAATNLGLGIGAQYLDRPLPYSQQWSFGFERELPGGWTVETSYVGNFTRRLPVSANVDYLPVNQLFQASTYYTTQVTNPMAGLLPNNAAKNDVNITRGDLRLPYPQYTRISLSSIPIGKQWYHGWQSNLERRLLQYEAAQKVTVLGTYELPIGRGRQFGKQLHPVLNGIVGGWQLNGNLTLQTGFPVAYPNAAAVAACSAELPSDQRTYEKWFDTSLWKDPSTGKVVATQAPYTLRTFPTRFPDVRTPGLKNMDASLFKDFPIRERMRLNFRLEWYNVTNTPWFTTVDTTVTSSTFGYLTLSSSNGAKRANLALRLLW